ncbi:MAG: hypothetical protein ACFBSD_03090 [Paracoccaceae bacterium]
MHPADELHAVRQQIRHLKMREAALRARLIAADDRARRRFAAEVETRITRKIDGANLPLSVRADPRSQLARKTVSVRLTPV